MRIRRLIHYVIPRDPCVVLVVRRDFGPEPDEAVLKIFVAPKKRDVSPTVGVPAPALTPGSGVHVDDGVDGMFGAEIDDTVEVFEAIDFEDSRV